MRIPNAEAALVLTVLAATTACGADPPPAAKSQPVASASPAPPTAAASDASTPPAPLRADAVAALRSLIASEKLLAGPAAWTFGDVSSAFAVGAAELFWADRDTDGKWALGRSATIPFEKLTGPPVLRDITGDGKPELAIFVTGAPADLGRIVSTVRIFGALPSAGARFVPTEMRQAEFALVGVSSESQLDLALPKINAFEPPSDETPTARLIARLPYATPAELRTVISPRGLRVCTAARSSAGERKCTRYAQAALSDRVLAEVVRPALGEMIRYEGSADRELAGVGSVVVSGCTDDHGIESCEGCTAIGLFCAPTGVTWSFEGKGRDRRLVELAAWEIH